MEKEMLTKILEEINKLNTKFEGLNDKFEGLNDKLEKHLVEFEEFKEEFRKHDEGVKNAWEKFEDVIGEEFNKVNGRLDKISVKIKFLEMGMQEIYLMHNKQFNLAEDEEHYKIFRDEE